MIRLMLAFSAATLAAAGQTRPVSVVIETELGSIEAEIAGDRAPITAQNFLKYVDAGLYDGGSFHRTVKPGNQPDRDVKIEVIQAGRVPGSAGFPPIPLERTSVTGLSHKDGTLSMARNGPDTASSDFSICIGDQPSLDFGGKRNPDGQGFAAFGRVVKGMDVVRKIQASPASGQRLTPPIRILKITRIPLAALAAASSDADAPPDQDAATSKDAAAAPGTPMVDWSPAQKLPSWLQLGGQIRGRFEDPSGTSMVSSGSDAYYLSRIRVDLGIQPVSWLRFFVEAQDARVGGYNTAPAPATIYNPMDLRQGYVAVNAEGPLGVGVSLRVGRQELLFGGERLIGPADWGMSRTFDALDLSVARGNARLDLFAGSAVLIDPTRFDRHKPGEHVYGAYGSIRNVLPGVNVEPYLLFKQTLLIKSEEGAIGDALVVSPGARVFGKAPGRLDYTVELVLQRGSYSGDRVVAMGQSYVAGWTMADSAWKPRVSVEYNYASGDPTSKDGLRGTFDQFYPSNHGYYGMIDQFGWKNLKNRRAGFDCLPHRKLKLRADYNQFYLATVEDSLYNSSGSSIVLNRKATSNQIGWELNSVALYQWSKIWKFGFGYAHLFAGDYLKQAKAGFGYTYPYWMFVGNF